MDRIESLGNQLSQITMYDIKSMYNQAKNVVLNVSEIEAKVREATNDDPWGASSTLMQDIANRTFNYPDFNEIMPSIYARFMEKEARQWRQIYKALQLLEYLIKNGSERVVDDARSHISTIKMLRSFHYIDDKGKDEGLNVRNRAKEIVELLSDVEKIRSERRKAKANKSKYTGVGSDGGFSGGGGGGGRYGGFGSESGDYGGGRSDYSNRGASYSGSGGGSYNSSGGGSSSFRDESARGGFQEYDAGDDEEVSAPVRSKPPPSRLGASVAAAPPVAKAAPAPAVVEEDLLGGFGDDAFGSAPAIKPPVFSVEKALPAVAPTPVAAPVVSIDDDDFDDFQAAPVTPAPQQPTKQNVFSMLQQTPSPAPVPAVGGFGQTQPAPPNMFNNSMGMGGSYGFNVNAAGGMHRQTPSLSGPIQQQPVYGGLGMQPTHSSIGGALRPSAQTPTTTPKPPASANFDDLWSMSLGSAKPSTPTGAAKSIKDLEKEKATAGLWGQQQQQQQQKTQFGNNNAFGAFGSGAPPSSSGGGDDLLL